MVKLRQYQLGDEIKTLGDRWKTPFTVEVIHKGYVVAVNRRQAKNPVFLFIKTYSREVFYGSSRFLKYGITTKKDIREFIEAVIRNEYKLEYDNCASVDHILDESEFIKNERREQIRYE